MIGSYHSSSFDIIAARSSASTGDRDERRFRLSRCLMADALPPDILGVDAAEDQGR
jgi:hypothetical protein